MTCYSIHVSKQISEKTSVAFSFYFFFRTLLKCPKSWYSKMKFIIFHKQMTINMIKHINMCIMSNWINCIHHNEQICWQISNKWCIDNVLPWKPNKNKWGKNRKIFDINGWISLCVDIMVHIMYALWCYMPDVLNKCKISVIQTYLWVLWGSFNN